MPAGFVASNQHFTGMPHNFKDMIVNTVQVFNIYSINNLQHFSIFYNISIFSFQSLRVALPEIYSIFIFKSVQLHFFGGHNLTH